MEKMAFIFEHEAFDDMVMRQQWGHQFPYRLFHYKIKIFRCRLAAIAH
jgi:hypothetical protein